MQPTILGLAVLVMLAGCQTAEELAAADDRQCQSFGAAPGSDAYVQCRLTISTQRTADANAYSRSVLAAQLAHPPYQAPRQCSTIRVGNTLQTTCN